jgi:hypothetical protein
MTEAHLTERLIRLLIAVGGVLAGVVSTIVGSWISSKIHVYHQNRTVHLEAIRDKVLTPLRSGLEQHLRPLVNQQAPVISVKLDSQHFKDAAKVTEDPTTWATLIEADFPFGRVFGGIEPALLDDAKTCHYSDLMRTLDTFSAEWIDYARECHAWVSELAARIFSNSHLPAFLPNMSRPYVMQCELANFVYKRLFRFTTGSVRKTQDSEGWLLIYGSQSVAAGTPEQLDVLIEMLDNLLESEKPRATALQTKRAALQTRFSELVAKLDSAIASQRLHGRCDLVTFL